jgi:hypothetical protein
MMDQKIILKQMIDFHKSAFMNSYNAMVMFQDQTEKMLDAFLGQANLVSPDFKKVMAELVATCKKGRDEFKKAVDENFKRLEENGSAAEKSQAKTK